MDLFPPKAREQSLDDECTDLNDFDCFKSRSIVVSYIDIHREPGLIGVAYHQSQYPL